MWKKHDGLIDAHIFYVTISTFQNENINLFYYYLLSNKCIFRAYCTVKISKLSNKIRSLVSEFQNVITDCAYMTTTQGTWPQQWNVTERPFQIVMPRGAKQAKGLLLSCIEEPDPCIIFEPKILYRTAIDDVPTADYKIEIGKAEVVREGRRRGGRQVLWISFTL